MIRSSDVRGEVLASLRGHFQALAASFADAPEDIRLGLLADFTFQETPVDPSLLSTLEARLPVPPPPALRAFLSVGHFGAIEAHEFTLPGVTLPSPKSDITALLLRQELWPCGYLQIGFGPCGDPLCLDIQQPQPAGEFPVVVFNHDLIPRQAWSSRGTLRPFAVPVASSFLTLLAGLCSRNEGPPWGTAA